MLVNVVTIHFYKLLEDGRFAASALDCEASRVVEVAVYMAAMFIV